MTNIVSELFESEKKKEEFSNSLEQIEFYQSTTPASVVTAFKRLYDRVDLEDMKLILTFFIQVAKIGTFSQKECIFIPCDSIFDQIHHEIPPSLSDALSLITYINPEQFFISQPHIDSLI